MNPYTHTGRIALHLAAWAHHPSHARFHFAGIARELNETGTTGLLAAFGWIGLWILLLL